MAEFSWGSDAPMTLQSVFNGALQIGADSSYVTPRTSDTVTGDAINGSVPIDNESGGSWSGFWQDTLKAVVGYQIAKDATKHSVAQPDGYMPGPAPGQVAAAQASPMSRWIMPALLIGGTVLVVVALRK
jgi:hypothetical protein